MSVWDIPVDWLLLTVESEALVVLLELVEGFSVVGWFAYWVVSVGV